MDMRISFSNGLSDNVMIGSFLTGIVTAVVVVGNLSNRDVGIGRTRGYAFFFCNCQC